MTGDLLAQSHTLQVAHIKLNKFPTFSRLELPGHGVEATEAFSHLRVLGYLNNLPGVTGFITREYSLAGPSRRLYFTTENARRIDNIREEVERWDQSGVITPSEKCYLLACLVEASDQVANTAGTYYAYLKRLYRKAKNRLRLRPISMVNNQRRNEAHHIDAASLVVRTEADVYYLDPPYNGRNYGAYYHLPETLVLGDAPMVKGKCGMRGGIPESPFYHRSTASDAMNDLTKAVRGKLIVVHYAEDGLIPHRSILQQLKGRGTVRWTSWEVRAYSSQKVEGRRLNARHRLYSCLIKHTPQRNGAARG